MTNKQIETSREFRLWIGQIIVPLTVFMVASPEARNYVKIKATKVKGAIKTKFSK